MCYKCNKWYNDTIIHFISLISYPRVGHMHLLGTFHFITLLYALAHFYTLYDRPHFITLITYALHKAYKVIKRCIKYYFSAVPRQKEHTLFTLMHHYNTIIHIIDCIHIMTRHTLYHLYHTHCINQRMSFHGQTSCILSEAQLRSVLV